MTPDRAENTTVPRNTVTAMPGVIPSGKVVTAPISVRMAVPISTPGTKPKKAQHQRLFQHDAEEKPRAIPHRLEGRVFPQMVGHVRRQHLIDDDKAHQHADQHAKAEDHAGRALRLLIAQILLRGILVAADAQGLI